MTPEKVKQEIRKSGRTSIKEHILQGRNLAGLKVFPRLLVLRKSGASNSFLNT
jgi:hypothetical protein